mmetsp:Transcript_12325/g.10930  ORF Transcript_12325/g.10930 Transcript_12325/m.10930 type:complete len:107 (+) Transcript_12325:402-722(+)
MRRKGFGIKSSSPKLKNRQRNHSKIQVLSQRYDSYDLSESRYKTKIKKQPKRERPVFSSMSNYRSVKRKEYLEMYQGLDRSPTSVKESRSGVVRKLILEIKNQSAL